MLGDRVARMGASDEMEPEFRSRSAEGEASGDPAYESRLRRKIEEGLEDLDQGRYIPHETVRERFLGRA